MVTVSTRSTSAAEADFLRFRQARHRYLTSQQGPLALVSTNWIDSSQRLADVGGEWAPAPDGIVGLAVTATAADGVFLDDQPVDGTELVVGPGAVQPSRIRFSGGATGTVISGPDGQIALRVWDPTNKRSEHFDRVSAYDYNPDWVLEGRFVAVDPDRTIDIEHIKDAGRLRPELLPGDIEVELDGVNRTLAALTDDDKLLLVFRDTTSGVESYDLGRFLAVRPHPNGTVVLDFNRAYIPPCGFSDWFNCPMPPPANRFDFAVPAGEKLVLSF
jgi:uncharacterized protein (DUF1684 family)